MAPASPRHGVVGPGSRGGQVRDGERPVGGVAWQALEPQKGAEWWNKTWKTVCKKDRKMEVKKRMCLVTLGRILIDDTVACVERFLHLVEA